MRRFDTYHPISVTVYFLSVTLIAMFSMNPLILIPSLVFSLMIRISFANPRPRDHIFAAVLFLILSLLNPLFSHNGMTVLFVMNHNPITFEALLYGICAAGMVVSVLYWMSAYTAIMTSDRLLCVFSALSPKLSLILSMSLRFVPLFRERYRKVENTQRALGIYRGENIIDTLRARVRIFSILITWALEDGIVTADSMEARAYGTHRRSSYSIFRWTIADIITLLLSLVLCGVTVWGLSATTFSFYPAMTLSFTPLSVMGALAYTALCIVPFVINIKEAVRWNIYESRI